MKELLPLCEDAPFRAVSQAGLISSTDFKGVKDCLQKQFAPDRNELEWQFHLQGCVQKPGESLAEFAGELQLLAGRAYPCWSTDQQLELARNHFIQGVRLLYNYS